MTDDLTLTLTESDSREYELIPHGTIIDAKVSKVEKVTTGMKNDDGSAVEQIAFTFRLLDDSYGEERNSWGRTSTKFSTHEKCRLYAWVLELMGVDELPPGFKLRLGDLVGNECRVRIEVNEWDDKKADPDPETGEYPKKQNNRVSDVIRSKNVSERYEEPF